MRWTAVICLWISLCLVSAAAAAPMVVPGRHDVETAVFSGYEFDGDELRAPSALLLDINSGKILFEKEADTAYGPASLSKIATLALTYAALDDETARPDDEVRISERAWSVNVPGSNMFIEVGEEIPLEELMRGMIVASGNDACVAVAEHLAGTEENFVRRMNDLVADLGMEDTVLHTVHGLHAEGQQITPRDVARLVRYFWRSYPQAEEITTQKAYTYAGIEQFNRNGLLFRDDRVTGLKTGYTAESGFHFVATARDGDEYYAAVVMGIGAGEEMSQAEGKEAREADAERLLNWAFDSFARVEADLSPVVPAEMRVYRGEQREVGLRTVPAEVTVTVPAGEEDGIFLRPGLPERLVAPLSPDDPVGYIEVLWRENGDDGTGGEMRLAEAAVHPAEEVALGGWLRRLWDSIVLFFTRLFN